MRRDASSSNDAKKNDAMEAMAHLDEKQDLVTKNDEKILQKEIELKEVKEKLKTLEKVVQDLNCKFQQILEVNNILAKQLQDKTELCVGAKEIQTRLEVENQNLKAENQNLKAILYNMEEKGAACQKVQIGKSYFIVKHQSQSEVIK